MAAFDRRFWASWRISPVPSNHIEPAPREGVASRKARLAMRADVEREMRAEINVELDELEKGWMKVHSRDQKALRAHADFLAYLTSTHPGRNFTTEFIRFTTQRTKAANTASMEMLRVVKSHDEENSP